MPIEVLLSLLVGLITGIAGAFLGLGGGFIFVPFFHLALGLPIHKAVGSSLAAILFLTSSAFTAYLLQRRVDFKLALIIEAAAAPSAFLGAWLTQFLSSTYLRAAFAILTVYAGLYMLLALKVSGKGCSRIYSWRRKLRDRWGLSFEYMVDPLFAGLGGVGVGLVSGMLGVGGGIVAVPLMTVVLGVPIHVAIATVSLTNLANAVSGFGGHLMLGNVDFAIALVAGVGALLGAQLGPRICRRTQPTVLRRIVGLVLIIIALRMLISGS